MLSQQAKSIHKDNCCDRWSILIDFMIALSITVYWHRAMLAAA